MALQTDRLQPQEQPQEAAQEAFPDKRFPRNRRKMFRAQIGPSKIILISFLVLNCLFHNSKSQDQQWNTNDFMKREHSLVKPYQGVGVGIPNWDFWGSVMVTGSHVQITPNSQSQQGGLWNRVPVQMRNWEMQIQFKVSGSTKDLFGDGFAIWYARDRMIPGPVFGSRDYFYGLAIFADTYSNHNGPHNHQHPYISAMINNGTMNYDHDRDGTHTTIGGCEVKFRNVDHDTFIAIRYENNMLTISHDLYNKRAWEKCVSIHGVILPTGYYFGVSAATGDLSDAHDVVSIKVYELDATPEQLREDRSNVLPGSKFVEPPREHVEDKPSSSSWSGVKTFFSLLFGVLLLVIVVIVGIMIYQKQQENARKRFY